MRKILAAYVNSVPGQLTFTYDAFGKPKMRDGAIKFNLSHSSNWAVLAVSREEVGVDCEIFHSSIQYRDIRSLIVVDPADISDICSFFRTWTRKEAILKFFGFGLRMPLTAVHAPTTSDFLHQWISADAGRFSCRVTDVNAPNNLFVALAAQQNCVVHIFYLT